MSQSAAVGIHLQAKVFIDSAFLSWETVYRLAHKGDRQDLREIASAVG